ncbi:MAG: hypothetical protein IKB09_09290 [Oscillospiraceae bacterium]|nr:hypothetical protein [Oscillospiraceae bacterium]
MTYLKHMICGSAVGFVQYLLTVGLSYLSIMLPITSVLLIAFHLLVLFVAGWNILYRIRSFLTMLLRIVASVGSYLLAWSVCVHFGIIVSLERWIGIGSGAQNMQGMILLSFLFWILLVSIIMIIVKSFALREDEK